MIALLAAVLIQAQDPGASSRSPIVPPTPNPEAVAADTGSMRHSSGRVPPLARAVRVATPPRVDGKLDDPVWADAVPIAEFFQTQPDEGRPASERTEVRIVYDDAAIYVAARMFDSEPRLISTELSRRDRVSNSDELRVAFDAYHDHRTAFNFTVNPSGVKSDFLSSGDQSHGDDSWDPVWEVHTTRDSLGWTAEMRIPFSQLRYSTLDIQTWGINVVRYIHRKAESAWFAWKPRTDEGYTSFFGHLHGIQGLPQPRRIEALPYLTMRQERTPFTPGDRFNDGTSELGAAGVDLKLGVTSSLTLDATFNPDFGQVEQDPAFVNLSAFEQFLSERRPFFVESADIFSFSGMQLFYSRRIGRPPQGFPDTPGEFQDVPENTTIVGAAKLTGRSGPWSVGVIEAVTAREFATTYDPLTGNLYRDQVEPLTNYAVARLRRDLNGGASQVGIIGTAVNRDLRGGQLRFLRGSAYTGGADFSHRFGSNTWQLSGSFAMSAVSGDTLAINRAQRSSARYYQRPDADHLTYDSTRTGLQGYFARLQFRRLRGNWTYSVSGNAASPGFEANDLGFQTRADYANAGVSVQRRWTRPGRVFREAQWGWDLSGNWDFGGVRTNTFLGSWTWAQFHNYWSINSSIGFNPPARSNNLTRGGPLGYNAMGGSFWLSVNTDYRKRWQVWAGFNYFGNEIGANYTGLYTEFSVRPTSAIRIAVGPSIDVGRTVQQFLQTDDDSAATATYARRYVFGEVVQRSLDLTTRLDLTFSPTLSLQLFMQPFVATGGFSNFKELRRPGEYDFLIYGRDGGSSLVSFCFDDDGNQTPCTGPGAPVPSYFEADPDGAGPRPVSTISNPDYSVRSLRGNAVLRWEYRPGSTVFLVWTGNCGYYQSRPRFSPWNDVGHLCAGRSSNVFAVKFNYWLSL